MHKEILLAHFPKITTKRYQQLLAAFSSLDHAWHAEFDALKKTGWGDEIIHEFLIWKEKIDEKKIQKIFDHEDIHAITHENDEFPELLKQVYDPPFCLFIRGKIPQDSYNLAVVGTRKFTPYGKQITQELITPLSHQGITIVSGLARGIDSIAHEATLSSGGTTIAVLGSGINDRHVYPSAHRDLAKQIVDSGGAVISEYPPGALPNKYTFPRRNRIIAGMSLGTLVIEARKKSGALITADYALDHGRDVFAIPHNLTAQTGDGPNNLIKSGAKLVTTHEDILDALNLQDIAQYVTNKEILPNSPQETKILEFLTREPTHVDELIKQSHMPSQEVNATLTMMEMKGKIKNMGNMMYVLSR